MTKLHSFSRLVNFLAVFFLAFNLNAQILVNQNFESCAVGQLPLSGCGTPAFIPFAGSPSIVDPECFSTRALKLPIPRYGKCPDNENVTLGSGVYVDGNFTPGTYKITYQVCGLANHIAWKFTNNVSPFSGTPIADALFCNMPCDNEEYLMPNMTGANSDVIDFISGNVLSLTSTITITSTFNKLTFRAFNDPPGQTPSGNSNCSALRLDNVIVERLCNAEFTFNVCRINDNLRINVASNSSNPTNNWQIFSMPSNTLIYNGNNGNNASITIPLSSIVAGDTQLRIVHNVTNGTICKGTSEQLYTIPIYPNINSLFNITYNLGLNNYSLTASSTQTGVTHSWRVERVSPLQLLCTSTAASITCSGLLYNVQYRVSHTVKLISSTICYERTTRQLVTTQKNGFVTVENEGSSGLNKVQSNNFNTEPTPQDTELKTYPNPTQDILNVDTFSTDNAEISMTNSVGQVIYQGNITKGSNAFTIETSNYQNGIYFLSINKDGKPLKTEKIIINH